MSKRKHGDRRDGTLVRDVTPMQTIMFRIKPSRCDSDVYINEKIDVTDFIDYMDKLKKKNPDNYPTYFHGIGFAIAKTIYNRPKLNRFIVNHKLYQRDLVSLGFVAKVKFDDHAEELMTLVKVPNNYKLTDLSKEIRSHVKEIRESTKKNATDGLIAKVFKLPGFIVGMIVSIFKFLDRHDLLPQSLCDTLLYYSSVLVSDIGTFDCDAIYHNITNFGTNSIMLMIGAIREENVISENGKVSKRKFITLGVNLDERIADGYYFIKSVKVLKHILANPKLLEDEVGQTVEIK